MLHLKAGQTIAGKYRLEHELEKGGMGSVWAARNLQLEIPVAIKLLAPDLSAEREPGARLRREARSAAQIRSSHVVHVYEHGVAEGVPFMAMELLEGEDLSKRLRARGRLSIDETARIVVDVCKALRRAHEIGIVHRDLKPANIFLCRQDEEEIVKVLDFGIAKLLLPLVKDELTETGTLLGTPHYMSPEQARRTAKDVDHRTDLWALGVIAYRALTGRLPFSGETTIDVLLHVCAQNEPIAPPSQVAPGLGPAVDSFFARALARRREARFQSAREMADAMLALAEAPVSRPPATASAAPQPVEAQPPDPHRGRLRRRSSNVVWTATVVVLLIGALGWVLAFGMDAATGEPALLPALHAPAVDAIPAATTGARAPDEPAGAASEPATSRASLPPFRSSPSPRAPPRSAASRCSHRAKTR